MNKEEMNKETNIDDALDNAINAIKKIYDIRLEEYPIRTKHLTEALKT